MATKAHEQNRPFPARAACRRLGALAISLAFVLPASGAARAEERAARDLFGAIAMPASLPTQSIGSYAKGCLAGAVALPVDGPNWQVMRLSRNRNWGHPAMVALVEKLAADAARLDGWPGLLVGDMSQPRGGPMKNGHASHQVGLDVDIWLTPMPDRRLSREERETLPFTSVLKKGTLEVDPARWSDAYAGVIMQAASYPEVQRIFVHPGIKKKLCETWRGDRSLLAKVRPNWGHDEHFHIRIRCQAGSPGCQPQASVPESDGCDKTLAWWFTDEPWRPAKPSAKPVKPRLTQLSDLPRACAAVLSAPSTMIAAAPAPTRVSASASAFAGGPVAGPATEPATGYGAAADSVPLPTPRPATN